MEPLPDQAAADGGQRGDSLAAPARTPGESVIVRRADLHKLVIACLRYLPDDVHQDVREAFSRLDEARQQAADVAEAAGPRFRPGDQPPPVPNDGPSMHDLVIGDLARCLAPESQREAAQSLILARKQLGLDRYKSLLQAHNNRSWLRDMTDEIADACCYRRQGLEEGDNPASLEYVYRELLHMLCLIAEAAAQGGDRS